LKAKGAGKSRTTELVSRGVEDASNNKKNRQIGKAYKFNFGKTSLKKKGEKQDLGRQVLRKKMTPYQEWANRNMEVAGKILSKKDSDWGMLSVRRRQHFEGGVSGCNNRGREKKGGVKQN